ncbi:hypothetical protein MKX03_005480, partial [Papaver bracteatum]
MVESEDSDGVGLIEFLKVDIAVGYDVQVYVLKMEITGGLWSDVGAGAAMKCC